MIRRGGGGGWGVSCHLALSRNRLTTSGDRGRLATMAARFTPLLAFVGCTGADYDFKPQDTPCGEGFGMAADGNCYPLGGDSDNAGDSPDSGRDAADSGDGPADSAAGDPGTTDSGAVDSGEDTGKSEAGDDCAGGPSLASLSFDGLDDAVQLDSFDTTAITAMTVEVWVYYDGGGDFNQRVVANRSASNDLLDPFTIIIAKDNADNPDAVEYGFTDGATSDGGWGVHSTNPIVPNIWTHVATTYDRTTGIVEVFLNGALEGSGVAPYEAAVGAYPLWLGADPVHGVSGRDFSGSLDEFVIWDHIRTPEEIACDMTSDVGGDEVGLLIAWRLEEGAGQQVTDLSPFAQHGRLGSSIDADSSDPAWASGVPR